MITIIGANGVMGRRYQAILKHLGKSYKGLDLGDDMHQMNKATKIIVATPTDTHDEVISQINNLKTDVDILCEKPITKNDIKKTYKQCEDSGNRLFCVNQYQYFFPHQRPEPNPVSMYDYFNHGKDGLHWDCFQIYALAKGSVTLGETSPFWKCVINDFRYDIAQMDIAYVAMIQDFLGPKKHMWPKELVIETTEKIKKL